MEKRYANLTKPLVIRGKLIKSRFLYPVAQPHFLQGDEKYPTDGVISFYADRAKEGVGITLFQDLTNPYQRDMDLDDIPHFCMYDITDKGAQNGFTQLAEYVHYYGSYILPEINLDKRFPWTVNEPVRGDRPDGHFDVGGMLVHLMMEAAEKKGETNGRPGAPIPMGDGQKAHTAETIAKHIELHVQHALLYKSLNYDGVYLDFSPNNFVIGQFMASASNHRTDEFGGSFENRIRFPMMLLKALREACGEEFIIGISNVTMDTFEETAEFYKLAAPYIDLIQNRGGARVSERPMGIEGPPGEVSPAMESSRMLKDMGVRTPIAISTPYQDLDKLDSIIGEGWADLIGAGHMFIANQHIDEYLKNGNGEDMNPCIECHICRGSHSDSDWMSHCTINPEMGMEWRAGKMIEPVTEQKKVAIIGGGPGGMKCALYLKERGHTPVIFEASDALGGQIRTSEGVSFKWKLERYLNFLRDQMVRKGIEVRLNTPATPEMIEAEGFDVCVAAVGGHAKRPNVPGAETARWDGISIYGSEDKIGKKVVVVGGASVACEAATWLAMNGHEVIELCRKRQVAYDLNPIIKIGSVNGQARAAGVDIRTMAVTTAITANSVTWTDREGEHTVECDDVVACGGMEPNSEAALAFASCAKEFYAIGDCRQNGTMRHAIRDAYTVAMRI